MRLILVVKMVRNGKIEIDKVNGHSFDLWKLKMEDMQVDKDEWIAIEMGTNPTIISTED